MLQILDKKGFQVKFETLKHGMHTPVYNNGMYPPPGLVTSRINT